MSTEAIIVGYCLAWDASIVCKKCYDMEGEHYDGSGDDAIFSDEEDAQEKCDCCGEDLVSKL